MIFQTVAFRILAGFEYSFTRFQQCFLIDLANKPIGIFKSAVVGSRQRIVAAFQRMDRASEIEHISAARDLPDASSAGVVRGQNQRRSNKNSRVNKERSPALLAMAFRENEFQEWNWHDNLVKTRMTLSFAVAPRIAILLGLLLASDAFAQDESIDKLLNKLPPPEKLLKPRVQQQQDPAFRDALGQEAVSSISKGDLQRAMDLSRKLTERYPHSAPAYCLRGSLACSLRQYGEATSAFHTAVGIQPRSADAYFGLGLVECARGHFAAALPHLQRSAKLAPDSFIPYFFLSDCAQSLGRKEESRQYAKKATELEPSMVFTWLQLARAEKELGHTEATLDAVSKAAEIAPDSAALLALVGYSYISANRLEQAIPPLQRAARLAPRDYLVQSQLGYCLATTGQVDAAIVYLRKGASLAPSFGPVWENLGMLYQKKGNHRDAVKAFEKATQLLPNRRLSWQHLAEEYRAVGRAQDAQRAAARAQSLPAGNSKRGGKKV